MSFSNDARIALARRIAEVRELLQRERYVPRLLYKEGEDPRQIYQLHHFLEPNLFKEENILKDDQVVPYRRLVLIGNAGSGKSLILGYAFLRASESFLKDSALPVPFLLDLHNELAPDNDVARALDFKYQKLFTRALSEHVAGCSLLLDGLDERLLKESPRFVKSLEFFLEDNGGRLAGSIIACRRAAWNPNWFQSLRVHVYHVDYVGHKDYARIISDQSSRQYFFSSCEDVGISDLLSNPFDGFYLARKFASNQPLPRSRRECLDQRIGDSLQAAARSGEVAPPVNRLRFWAGQLACLSIFTGKDSHTPQEAVNSLGQSDVFRSTVNQDEISVLLHRPLFKKQGEKFAFTHQLYSEFLAAECLRDLSLRKQRQLLGAKLPSVTRVCTLYRGVAAFLAEMSVGYCRYLLQHDPLVLFFAEAPELLPEEDELLLRSVLERSITDHRAPWWEIPPRGERPLSVIAKHHPQRVEGFLSSYLEDQREIARLWATACAEVWGGCSALNPTLNRYAHDPSQHQEIRTWAIQAIMKSGDPEAVHALYDLFDDHDDRVRGLVLQAYRKTSSPSPRNYLQKLLGGSRDRHLLCMLQIEAKEFGLSIAGNRLFEAFQAVEEYFDQLEDLRNEVLAGLFERALNEEFDNIPCGLIVKLCTGHGTRRASFERTLRQLLKKEAVCGNLVTYVLDLLKDDKNEFHYWELADFLASSCDDSILNVIEKSASGVTADQERFLRRILWSYFRQQPTEDRLTYFQQRVPRFANNLQLPKTREQQPRDTLEERQIILGAIEDSDENPVNQTWRLLVAFARIEHGDRAREVKLEDVQSVLGRTSTLIRKKVLKVFQNCVESVSYKKEWQGGRTFSMTRREFEIPFWALRAEWQRFAPKKIKEIICCYGFSGSSAEDEKPYKSLLEELGHEDQDLWRDCVIEILENSGLRSPTLVLRYLVEIEEPLYIERCSERLCQGVFTPLDFSDLLFYWHAFHPGNYSATLRACYEHLRCPFLEPKKESPAELRSDSSSEAKGKERTHAVLECDAETQNRSSGGPSQFDRWAQWRPLFMLLADDDDWAWQELGSRLQQQDIPIDVDFSEIYTKRLPLNSKRLRIMADWYGFIRRRLRDPYEGFHNTPGVLLEAIVSIGGEAAISELRRLQAQRAFPDEQWLSHPILRIEDQMLTEAKSSLVVEELLSFVNKPSLGIVSDNRDLFEWACEAIEHVKESLELRAEGVAGFWNRDNPKDEPECQNVLWPFVRERLSSLGIANVEEKFIGANKCDFWVLLPRKDDVLLQVAVELKVARVGYGPTDLLDPIEKQLWRKYLYPEKCRYGVYIVLWFKDNQRYKGPERWPSIQELAKDVKERCRVVAAARRVSIAPYLVDLTTAYRKH
jgi:hypothetical protein